MHRGKPLARIVLETLKPKDSKRGYGALRGLLNLPEGWNSLEEKAKITELFEGLKHSDNLGLK